MQVIDFIYDGQNLSDMGLKPCFFDSPDEEQEIGNLVVPGDAKAPHTNEFLPVGMSYEDPFEFECQASKDPCTEQQNFEFSDEEINQIVRWLNRRGYYKCQPIYDDGSFEDVYYMGFFNISLVKIAGKVMGFTFSFTANAPYGFQEIAPLTHTFAGGDTWTVEDVSDEVGFANAETKITCKAAGDLKITNEADPDNIVIVKNCQQDEVITLYGKTKIITSSLAGHTKLYNDFNYNWVRMVNTYTSRENKFTCNLAADIEIKYAPIRKVGVVL